MAAMMRKVFSPVLEPDSQAGPARFHVARELQALGLTAKQIAGHVLLATRANMKIKTVHNALAGVACSLDTYFALARTFGWDFAEAVETSNIGVDPLTAREQELLRDRDRLAAREQHLERARAVDRAIRAADEAGLRLLADEDRTWTARPGFAPRA